MCFIRPGARSHAPDRHLSVPAPHVRSRHIRPPNSRTCVSGKLHPRASSFPAASPSCLERPQTNRPRVSSNFVAAIRCTLVNDLCATSISVDRADSDSSGAEILIEDAGRREIRRDADELRRAHVQPDRARPVAASDPRSLRRIVDPYDRTPIRTEIECDHPLAKIRSADLVGHRSVGCCHKQIRGRHENVLPF